MVTCKSVTNICTSIHSCSSVAGAPPPGQHTSYQCGLVLDFVAGRENDNNAVDVQRGGKGNEIRKAPVIPIASLVQLGEPNC